MELKPKVPEKSWNSKMGRVRPVLLAFLIIVAGLWADRWWWEVGLIILIVVLVEGYYRYRT